MFMPLPLHSLPLHYFSVTNAIDTPIHAVAYKKQNNKMHGVPREELLLYTEEEEEEKRIMKVLRRAFDWK